MHLSFGRDLDVAEAQAPGLGLVAGDSLAARVSAEVHRVSRFTVNQRSRPELLRSWASSITQDAPILARVSEDDGQALNITVTLDCNVRKITSLIPFASFFGVEPQYEKECSARWGCHDADMDWAKSYQECLLTPNDKGYCDKTYKSKLACSKPIPQRVIYPLVRRARLSPAPPIETRQISRYEDRSCSLGDGRSSFEEFEAERTKGGHGDMYPDRLIDNFYYYGQHAAVVYCDEIRERDFRCNERCHDVNLHTMTFVRHFRGSKSDVAGYVAIDRRREEIVLAIRGTASVANCLTNLDGDFQDCPFVDGCKVRQGFHEAWLELADVVTAALREAQRATHGRYPIVATGHSLGGAVVTIADSYLRWEGFDALTTYTYGAPRVGNAALVNHIMSRPGTFYRITHSGDPVPRVPLVKDDYAHPAPEYWIANQTDPSAVRSGTPDAVHDFDAPNVGVCTGIADPLCNAGVGFLSLALAAHSRYFVPDICPQSDSRASQGKRPLRRRHDESIDPQMLRVIENDRQLTLEAAVKRQTGL
ncbi:hypothetical protein HIM_05981 [Hirsutella minnesotensis 3608]|uniref:Fungal lipase-type domain-containing protein n=1 Tax=Hirsutella minnesotensis 3608 TaxID=1043627 RepID=A0A0F7ZJR1_9HYPO|nr:hypothetical protein HIM_05981 [Hirsutella minnesotensis 3608]